MEGVQPKSRNDPNASGKPASQGFFMPAEWEKHEATWLSWPKNPETFPAGIIGNVEEAYCRMVKALSSGEKVKLLVDNENEEQRVERILSKSGAYSSSVLFQRIKSVDVWMRDYGPTFLRDSKGGKAMVRWKFNAWGGKYDDLAEDNKTGDAIAKTAAEESGGKTAVFMPGIVMEGGSIEVNGQGSAITTEQCLLNRNRNPHLGKGEIGECLRDYLGARSIIWLKEGIAGDDTDGHVDDFARFVGTSTVLCAREKDRNDGNYLALEENYRALCKSKDQEGELLEVVELPMPRPIVDPEEHRRLPASYANFYIGNRAVLVPSFNDRNDAQATGILQSCFPGREIVMVPCRELVYGYGGIHCVTQQEPK